MSSLKHLATGGSCPQLQLLGQIAVLEKGSMGFKKPEKKGRLQLKYKLRVKGIWEWRKQVWSEETWAYQSQWVSYQLSHQTELTNLGCYHFCVHHIAFCVYHVSHMDAGRGSFSLSQLFLPRRIAGSMAEDSCRGQHC